MESNLSSLINHGNKKMKGPIGLPFIGNLLQLSNMPTHLQLTEFSHVYGNIYKLKLGNYKAVVINGVAGVHQALVKQADDFCCRPGFDSFKEYAGGLSISFQRYGTVLKEHRAAAIRVLRQINCRERGTAAVAVRRGSATLLERVRRSNEQPIDVGGLITDAVGAILYRICFGGDISADPEYARFVAEENPSTQLFAACNQPDLLPTWLRWLWQAGASKDNNERMKTLCALNERMVRDWRSEEHSADDRDSNCVMNLMMSAAADLPSINADDSDVLTKEHLLSTTIELISAGTETSSTTIAWLLLFMAAYPDIQRRLQCELYADAESAYLEAVVLEVTRLSTIVPFALPHRCRRSTSLYGYAIEENTMVLANLWSVGHDREFWGPDVDLFRPERFLKVVEKDTPLKVNHTLSNQLMLFGAGRRKCIGETLGKLQVNTIFRDLISEFQVVGAGGRVDLTPVFGDILKPKPFKVIFKPRLCH